jgi:excisionase family DNA binding protein
MSRYNFIYIPEICRQLDHGREFVENLFATKKLAYYQIGGRKCVLQEDIDAYVERERVAAAGEKKTIKRQPPKWALEQSEIADKS